MRKETIRDAYGFDFPPDLHRFWRVACAHEDVLFEAGIRLVGPFTILGGGKPAADLERWPGDPPELFVVAEGDTDGLHWGYVFHEPGVRPGHVAWFHARDGYPIEGAASTLSQAIHEHVSAVLSDREDELAEIHAIG